MVNTKTVHEHKARCTTGENNGGIGVWVSREWQTTKSSTNNLRVVQLIPVLNEPEDDQRVIVRALVGPWQNLTVLDDLVISPDLADAVTGMVIAKHFGQSVEVAPLPREVTDNAISLRRREVRASLRNTTMDTRWSEYLRLKGDLLGIDFNTL